MTATARKIAVLFYNTLRHGMTYKDPGTDHYEEQYRCRVLANLKRRAKSLGFVLQLFRVTLRWLFLRKAAAYFAKEFDVKFGFIAKHRGFWPAGWLCEALGVSQGGFYAWLTRPRSRRNRSNEELGARVRASFLGSDRWRRHQCRWRRQHDQRQWEGRHD